MNNPTGGALADLRVIELSNERSVFAGKLHDGCLLLWSQFRHRSLHESRLRRILPVKILPLILSLILSAEFSIVICLIPT